MKKIINGKLYNTDTATLIGEHWNGYSLSDFNYEREALFQKKTKEFFLFGEGGPMTDYCDYSGNYRTYGERIIPYDVEDAKSWCARYLDVDKYCEIFGEPEE